MIIKLPEDTVRIFPLEMAVPRLAIRLQARRGVFFPDSEAWAHDADSTTEILLRLKGGPNPIGYWRYIVGRN